MFIRHHPTKCRKMSGQFYVMIGQDDWKHLTSTSCIIFSIVLSVNKILIMYGQIICKNLMSDQKEDLIEHIMSRGWRTMISRTAKWSRVQSDLLWEDSMKIMCSPSTYSITSQEVFCLVMTWSMKLPKNNTYEKMIKIGGSHFITQNKYSE